MSSGAGMSRGSERSTRRATSVHLRRRRQQRASLLACGRPRKEPEMNARSDRLFAVCGIAFVALQFGGTFLAMAAGKTHDLTIGSSTAGIARAIAHPVGSGVWAGAYMEMLSVCFFLAFAVWAAERLGGGVLGSVVKVAAA